MGYLVSISLTRFVCFYFYFLKSNVLIITLRLVYIFTLVFHFNIVVVNYLSKINIWMNKNKERRRVVEWLVIKKEGINPLNICETN